MEMEGMEGAILIFMLGNMEQTVARKQTKREKNNAQKRTEGWKRKFLCCQSTDTHKNVCRKI